VGVAVGEDVSAVGAAVHSATCTSRDRRWRSAGSAALEPAQGTPYETARVGRLRT
jgi:hypothetical protein